ncbi:hypothetical protein COLO4_25707 [Corchorus olitorius]|uniref:Uncharacterized protein n=1 Tax=Corchorus olitorius TaxID=93759 RepID=A0A1R3I0B4_9ROSI|nr:hypothetical protein COLO4_25707 [Corchorus olitorius]
MHEKAKDIMCLWHQLCHNLCVMEISVEDETNWKGMNLGYSTGLHLGVESKTKSKFSKVRVHANGSMSREDLGKTANDKDKWMGDSIGDIGLLDYVLAQKVITSGQYAVQRSQQNRRFVFTIEQNLQGAKQNTERAEDLLFLYQHLLLAHPLAEKGWEDASQGIIEVARSIKNVQLEEAIQKGLRNTFCALANLVVTDLEPAYMNDENPLKKGQLVTTPIVVRGTGYQSQQLAGAPEETASLIVEGPHLFGIQD